MTGFGKTAQEFIQSSFSPIIAVLCSQKVENVVSKNNLSFPELLQPFTALETDGQFREPGGSMCSVKNWKLIIRDINWKPLPPTEARRQLNNAVLHNYSDKTVPVDLEGRIFDVPQTTQWFDAWRETYLEVQFPSDHEFTKHFLSCIIVGAAHEENIIDTFNILNQQYAQLQNVTPPKLPKWFNSGVLKCYLLLHDVSIMRRERAEAVYETLKQNFGASSCFMLSINSKSTMDPNVSMDLWRQFVKRPSESYSDKSSSLTNLATTPAEPQPTGLIGEDNTISNSIQDNIHPLTSSENDFYDNANSLQTHSFSGSVESVSVSAKGIDLSTEIHGAALNSTDIEAIKQFLQDYAIKALLPYLEKNISQLSDVVANRKGVSRSLLSATKRWFGTGKAGSNTTGNNTVVYTNDCPELQLRRLGDLWFLCGQWQRAFDTYHTAKREFYADSAWLCYAGALEMAAISAFMAGDANRKTHGYMEESIVTYLNTCRMVQYAVRATLLSALCLTSSGLHGEAAKQLIRMTSEDSDLRSAMLLEQAALCFLSGPGSKAMCRKYAFHMVLAGHRFSKAGQKKHAYRCYKQAYQIYSGRGWRLASDHVQFALGRLAGSLRIPREAIEWLAGPLAPAPPPPQPPHQQDAFLREYMLAHHLAYSSNPMHNTDTKEEVEEKATELAVLPLPVVEQRSISTLCCGPAPLSSPRRRPASSHLVQNNLSEATDSGDVQDATEPRRWRTLEEMLLQVARGSVPMIFKPTVDLYTDTTDCDPVVPQGEPIQISVTLWNPLKISLILKDVELLWRFISLPNNNGVVEEYCNEPAVSTGNVVDNSVIVGQKHQSVLLEGDCKKVLTFTLTPLRVGQLSVQALSYKLINAGEGGNENGSNTVMIQGKANLISGIKSADKRLNISVIPEAPCLQVTFSETHSDIMSGEMRTVDVEFTNVGPVDMNNLYIAVSHPDCISLATSHDDIDHFQILYDDKYREPPQYSDERSMRSDTWRREATRHVRLVSGSVSRGSALRTALHLRACSSAPRLHLLAYYETGVPARPYRLLRHVFHFTPIALRGTYERQSYHRFGKQLSHREEPARNSDLSFLVVALREASLPDVAIVHILIHPEIVELSVTPTRSLRAVQNNVHENINLAVEVKNISTENVTVEILETSLLSRQWKLTSLTATRDECKLKSRERVHFVLRARRILENLPKDKVEHSCLKITEGHPDAVADIRASPYSKFIMNYKPSYIDTIDTNNIQDVNKNKGLIQSMFILRWKAHNSAKGISAIGQQCLWLDCFTKIQSLEREVTLIDNNIPLQLDEYDSKTDLTESKKNKQDNIVILRMNHSNQINHDFNENKLCIVPVTMNIVNCYGIPVKVFINLSKQKNREQFCELGWAGTLSSDGDSKDIGISVNLEKFESRSIEMRGLCAAPGTYLVGSAFTITTRAENNNLDVTNVSNNTSLLVVQQA